MRYSLQRVNVFAPSRKILKRAKLVAKHTELLKEKYRKMSNSQLSAKTDEFIQRIKSGESLDSMMAEVFATVRETIYRVKGIFAYQVQIVGAVIIHWGDFAELYTGEGKTITCVIAAYLNALLKNGVHIVTVNEYLVQRDAKFCAECLNPLKITVGYNLASFDAPTKKKMFACDITYTTNSELGFDYLRDNMVGRYEDKVIRGLNFAICDEGDSILIDEARTPLIISGQPKQNVSMYVEVDKFIKTLTADDYKRDLESNSINLTDAGVKKVEDHFKLANLHNIENSDLVNKIKNSLMANFVFKHGVEYIVKEDEIFLVDQFTGRIMEGRSYNAGLQQAIQAKEYVKIEPENIIVATITYQSLFRLYKKLAGCSGTAYTESEEFIKIYNMVVVNVPTNKPIIRKDLNDYVFANKISKWYHVAAEIERVNKTTKQPILVGTASVEDSEELAKILRNKGIHFELLNAKNHAKEAEIIKNAGQFGAITIATNMAGRGTDIKLGKGVSEVGGLYVIGTERHESRRIDNQLRGRSGRQGDAGTTRFFISLQDTLFKRFAIEKEKKSSEEIDNDFYNSNFFTRLLNITQKKVEGINFDMRKNLIDYDGVLSGQRELVYKQRDQILLFEDNSDTIVKMCSHVAKDLCMNAIDEENEIFVDKDKVAQFLNMRLLNANIIKPDFFAKTSIEDATHLVTYILQTSVKKRLHLLGPNAKNIVKDIMIQNFDYNWTNHLDKITKIREGVMLRSLEQRSPLNIYVNEADKNFAIMKKNVAIGCVVAIHRMFVPKANAEVYEEIKKHYKDAVIEQMQDVVARPVINILNKPTSILNKPNNVSVELKQEVDKKISEDTIKQEDAKKFEETKLDKEVDIVLETNDKK